MFHAPPARCRAVTIPVCPPSMPRARAPGAPVAWHELERSLVLRMDDPGLGLRLVSSYYQALRDRDRFCWTQHVVAPYLDRAEAASFDAGLPVVGYFHDRDLAIHGVSWLGKCLDRWQAAGARRLLDFRELATVVGRSLSLEEGPEGARLTAAGEGAPALVRPLMVGIRSPGTRPPARVHVRLDDREWPLEGE